MRCEKNKYEDVSQMILDMQRKLKAKKIDQMVAHKLLHNLMIKCNLPFIFVEHPEFRTLISYLCFEVIPISRNISKANMLRICEREKTIIKKLLCAIFGRICLTSDLWISINTEGFITLITHFADLNWKLNDKILNFRHMPPPHNGFELFKKINEFLHD